MNRNQEKVNLEAKVLGLMYEDEKFCGDDLHAATQELFEREYGFNISPEQIKFIDSVSRSRRKMLGKHPELDKRTGNGTDLEEQDREYYRKG